MKRRIPAKTANDFPTRRSEDYFSSDRTCATTSRCTRGWCGASGDTSRGARARGGSRLAVSKPQPNIMRPLSKENVKEFGRFG